MPEQTFLQKLHDEYFANNASNQPTVASFLSWAEQWLSKNAPIGTGFAEGTSAITIRFQDGNQYPLFLAAQTENNGPSVQITGQAGKTSKGGIVASPSFPITGN